MTNFDRAVAFLIDELEGGELTNDPLPTRWGLMASDGIDPVTLTREQAIPVYRERYWDNVHGDALPFPAAFLAFDTAVVNSGPHAAIVRLQHWLGGLEPDGIIGPMTLARAQKVCGNTDALLRFVNTCINERTNKTLQVYNQPDSDKTQMRGLIRRYLRAAGFALAWME